MCSASIFTHFRETFFIKWSWNQGSLCSLGLVHSVHKLPVISSFPFLFLGTRCVCFAAQSWPTLCHQSGTHQAPLSLEFSKQEYCNGLPFPTHRRSSWSRDWTPVSHISYNGRQILDYWHHLGSPMRNCIWPQKEEERLGTICLKGKALRTGERHTLCLSYNTKCTDKL